MVGLQKGHVQVFVDWRRRDSLVFFL